LFKLFSKERDIKKVIERIDKKNLLLRYGMLILGVFIYACSYNLFMLNNDLVAGGIGGVATIMKTMVDPALLIFIISLFLLLLSLILLGKEKTMASIIGSLLFPLFVKITSGLVSNIQIDNSDLLLIVLFAGIFEGFGCGLVFKAGFTTGGTDILNQIASKYAKVSLGTAMLMTDGIIVLSAGFFFGWTRVMYGIIILYLISFIADKVVLGISSSKAFYIVAEKEEEVKQYILNTLGHGVTILEGKGGFTNEKQKIFMCLIPTREYFKVKEGLEEIDKNAFFIVTDAYQSVGGS
jgi:uncharacterized membrane-anchored protein YitT (DUF2179 family)